MGYYTAYGLTVLGDPDKVEAFERELLHFSEYQGIPDSSVKELIECGGTYAKLYDIESWIAEAATIHPDVLIILSGDGEESSDMWECRWKGEKCERHDAIIPPFTIPELLTEEEKQNNN